MNCPHCDIPIDEHEASRCLDAWVAEAVMGFRYITLSPDDEQCPLVPPAHGYSEELCELRKEDYRRWWQGRDPEDLIPGYSTSIAAAWEVVEKNTSKTRRVELITSEEQNIAWIIGNKCEAEMGLYISASASTMPLAICRAGIKAISVASSGETRE